MANGRRRRMILRFAMPALFEKTVAASPAVQGVEMARRRPTPLDTIRRGRYADRMRWRIFLVVAGLGLMAPSWAAADDVPAIAVLEYSSGLFGSSAKILASTGSTPSPYAHKPKTAWTLRAGPALTQDNPPPDRVIRFYTLANKDPLLICSILVKYDRDAGGWRPRYLLMEPLAATWTGEKLVPIDPGLPGTIRIAQSVPAPTPGFAYQMTFGSTAGALSIDLWDVQ